MFLGGGSELEHLVETHTHTQGDLVKKTVTSAQDLNQVRWSCETETLDDVTLSPQCSVSTGYKIFLRCSWHLTLLHPVREEIFKENLFCT